MATSEFSAWHVTAELFQDKLSKSEAQVVWKDYSPSHFSGATGTFNGIDESIPGIPAREKCELASVGEFWCAHMQTTQRQLLMHMQADVQEDRGVLMLCPIKYGGDVQMEQT